MCSNSLLEYFFDRKKNLLEKRGHSGDGGDSEGMAGRGRGRGTGGSLVAGGVEYLHQMNNAWGKRGSTKTELPARPTRSLKGMPGLKVRTKEIEELDIKGEPDSPGLMDRAGWGRRKRGVRPSRPRRLPDDDHPLAGTGAIDSYGIHHIPLDSHQFPRDYGLPGK